MFIHKAVPQTMATQAAVLADLNKYINAVSPEITYWLCRLWDDQQQAITYKELQEALSGSGDFKQQLEQWQQDYAGFVNAKLAPIWLSSMQAAAQKLQARHDLFVFDDSSKQVREWITQHGAEWVTNVTNDTRAALRAIILRGQAERWTSEETACVMRPTIGLTAPQAVANANYYQSIKAAMVDAHPKTDPAKLEQQAQLAAARYAGRQHRYRAQTIAVTEGAFAYNKGVHESVRQAVEQGLMGPVVKVWSTAHDARTCPICSRLDGVTIGFDDDFDYKTKLAMSGIRQTPPAHPKCRCAVKYEETESPAIVKQPPMPELPTWDGKKWVDEPDPPDPHVPAKLTMPPGMKVTGAANLGGTGEIKRCVDASGKEWLFKPAQDKKGGTPAPFRAYAQEAAARVQQIVDPDTAVKVGVGVLDGRLGAFQELVDIQKSNTAMAIQKAIDQADAAMRSTIEDMAVQIQREHVTDWLIGNFDAHGGNFVTRSDGTIIGIDKEQAFKYMGDKASRKMSLTYHPNAKYGEHPPIYNGFFEAFAKKRIDINPQDSLPFIKRVEAIPDEKYREMFRDYAEALHGKGKAAENLLDAIVERKQTLRENYRDFYSDLLTVRAGRKIDFVFADEAAPAPKTPLSGKVFSKVALKKMNKADLLQIAKQKSIAYYSNMNKAQLIEAISDPVQAKEMSRQVKERLAMAKKARAEAKRKQAKRKNALPTIEDVLQDFNVIPKNRWGMPIRSDADAVENQMMTARFEQQGAEQYYTFWGKLSDGAFLKLAGPMKTAGAKKKLMVFNRADDTAAYFYDNDIVHGLPDLPGLSLETPSGKIELIDIKNSGVYTMNGFFRIRLPATGDASAKLKTFLHDIRADWMLEAPTQAAEYELKLNRALWQHETDKIGNEIMAMDMADKEAALKRYGIDAKRIGDMHQEEVWHGYAAYVDDAQAEEAVKHGVTYVWCGVSSARNLVNIVKTGGLACTKERMISGNFVGGASSGRDMETGGADGVFTRLGIKSHSKFHNSFCGYGWRIEIDPQVLGRTDWYSYAGDNFGTTEPVIFKNRRSLERMVKEEKTRYNTNNEIIFRNGIKTDKFIGINCDTDSARQDLINAFRREGIDEVNGVPIEKFIKVKEVVGT